MFSKRVKLPSMFVSAFLFVFVLAATASVASAASPEPEREYVLSAGDVVRITVFQNPDLTTETRVSETGAITFPLIGSVQVGGQSVPAAERLIAGRLSAGGFVRQPQVSILPLAMKGNQVAVLGQVNRPGRYPLETFNLKVSDLLALAGGVGQEGGDVAVLVGLREGKPIRREIDIPALFGAGAADDLMLSAGDVIYVDRAPMAYIYGEVQRPGAFRLERNMSVMQGLATGGGTTIRGTVRGLRIHRRDPGGELKVFEPGLDDLLRPDDVIYVKESLF